MTDFLVRLNDSWRVSDDPPQWVIEQRIGNASTKDSGWRARKFIRTTDHLLRRIDETCGDVDQAAIETLQSWPNGYVTWKVMEMRLSAGPGNTPYSAERAFDHLNHHLDRHAGAWRLIRCVRNPLPESDIGTEEIRALQRIKSSYL